MEDHIIIVGWNGSTRALLNKIKTRNPLQDIVLIDSTLPSKPHHNVKFIKGDPYSEKILHDADIKQAKYLLITSDPKKDEGEADQYSILITVTAKGIKPDIKVITEIQKQRHIENAKRSGADVVVDKNEIMGTIIANQLYNPQSSTYVEKIITRGSSSLKPSNDMIGKTFSQCYSKLMKEGKLLIGIMRNDELFINPKSDKIIDKSTLLILIMEEENKVGLSNT